MLHDFKTRADLSELMDEPDCDAVQLLRTLKQFKTVNWLVSRYQFILKRWIIADMLKDPERAYHLVDMGAGGCDIDVWLLKEVKKHGLNLRITACDIDPRTIQYAEATFGDHPGLTIQKMDLLSETPQEPIDYIFANHFLHHLKEEEITHLIRLWQPRTQRLLLFSDLQRNPWSYVGFSVLSLLFTNSFTRPDGLTSIRRSFTSNELSALTKGALSDSTFSVEQLLPGRLVLRIAGTNVKAT